MTHQSPHDKAADAVHEGRPVEAQYVRGGRGSAAAELFSLSTRAPEQPRSPGRSCRIAQSLSEAPP